MGYKIVRWGQVPDLSSVFLLFVALCPAADFHFVILVSCPNGSCDKSWGVCGAGALSEASDAG
jgi:hypothetical protein